MSSYSITAYLCEMGRKVSTVLVDMGGEISGKDKLTNMGRSDANKSKNVRKDLHE